MINPGGIAVHHHKVYIADCSNKRISVFQTDGEFRYTIGSGQLEDPNDVTVNGNNQLLVTDYAHHCIYTFTLAGHYVGNFGTHGTGRGELKHPYGIITDLHGFVLVADRDNHRVSIFDSDGNYISSFGSKGSAVGQFQRPYKIAISAYGNIYVSDHESKRIQIYY